MNYKPINRTSKRSENKTELNKFYIQTMMQALYETKNLVSGVMAFYFAFYGAIYIFALKDVSDLNLKNNIALFLLMSTNFAALFIFILGCGIFFGLLDVYNIFNSENLKTRENYILKNFMIRGAFASVGVVFVCVGAFFIMSGLSVDILCNNSPRLSGLNLYSCYKKIYSIKYIMYLIK